MNGFIKKVLGVVAVLALAATQAFGDVAINAANFPDAAFRDYISQNFDTNSDGVLSIAEIDTVYSINAQGMNLRGIEYFTSLRHLACLYHFVLHQSRLEFNYTEFKAFYGLPFDIDDSSFLMMDIEMNGSNRLMTPLIRDIADTSTGDYVLNIPLYQGQTLNGVSFRTTGTMNIEVYVEP